MSEEFDRGPLEPAVVLWFLGLPLWLIAASIVLGRRGVGKRPSNRLSCRDRE